MGGNTVSVDPAESLNVVVVAIFLHVTDWKF